MTFVDSSRKDRPIGSIGAPIYHQHNDNICYYKLKNVASVLNDMKYIFPNKGSGETTWNNVIAVSFFYRFFTMFEGGNYTANRELF